MGKKKTLEKISDSLCEKRVQPKMERALAVPEGPDESCQRLLLTVAFPGVIYDTDVGSCAARRGRRYIVADNNDSSYAPSPTASPRYSSGRRSNFPVESAIIS